MINGQAVVFFAGEKSPPTTSFPRCGKVYPVDISLRRRGYLIKAVKHISTAKIKLRRTPRRKEQSQWKTQLYIPVTVHTVRTI